MEGSHRQESVSPDEEISEEQRLRAESNRLAAIARRRAAVVHPSSSVTGSLNRWPLSKCRKLDLEGTPRVSRGESSEKFLVRLEICSPDSFSATPVPAQGFVFPREQSALRQLAGWLAEVSPSHYTQNLAGGKSCVYNLRDYNPVVRCLRSVEGLVYEEIPWGTFNVVEKLSHLFSTGHWMPCRPEHLSEEKVDELIGRLPKKIVETLLPFQLEGVRFGLRRGGRCLIADEMGLGKTLQAIAIACCFKDEGSILVVCPAVLRFSWAEELERWFPCLPTDIHLVFSHQDNPTHLKKWPKVVVISYKMLHHLRRSLVGRGWNLLIIDESHHLRCSKKVSEAEEIKVVLDLASKVQRIVLLSGTPSLSRPYDIFHQINMLWPGLLGKDKFEFAKTYCDVKLIRDSQGNFFKDFSRGTRLDELNILLRQTVMIRRLKEHVMMHLPPKRRQIIRLLLKKSDIVSAKAAVNVDSIEALEMENDKITGKSNHSNGNYLNVKYNCYIARLPCREALFPLACTNPALRRSPLRSQIKELCMGQCLLCK
ncbi:hypothetical protein MLD38_028010 [Melastoma candidum]|uniref:Uncharacterized protein n=1 Tax=Melastoma candidum TaxID=119954 RepID=A0ACB9N5S5_9MYRT|nr:hypothetical protein MLD38_028010 [Melastoma candidum]